MRLKLVAIFAVVVGLAAGSLWLGGTATGAPADPSLTPLTAKVEPAKAHKYVGTRNCRMCHKDHHKGWEATKMAKAFESLKPGVKAEAKKKHGLDPAKDYTTDPKCLSCHVTGFGEPGGYAVLGPMPDEKKQARKWKRAKKKMDALASVSCAACPSASTRWKSCTRPASRRWTRARAPTATTRRAPPSTRRRALTSSGTR